MRALLAIAFKDLRVLSRYKPAMFWVLGFPLAMALFFGAIFSGGNSGQRAMRVAIVDLDQSEYSRRFIEALEMSEALRLSAASYDSARVLVRQGKLVAYVAIRPGTADTFGFGAVDSTQGLEVGIDPSRRAESGYLKGLLTQAVFAAMQGQFAPGGSGRDIIARSLATARADTARTPEDRARVASVLVNLERFMTALDSSRAAEHPAGADRSGGFEGPSIRVIPIAENAEGPRSGWEITFPSSVLWALIGVCSSFAISIVSERTRGTFLRLRLAPVSRAQILAGKGLACLLAGAGVTTVLLALGVAVFHVRVHSAAQLAAAVLASTLCFVGLMMLISTLGKDERSVSGAGWAILLIQSMTGGGMIPLIAMPPWMQAISNFSVVKWGVLSIEGAIWRGFSWSEMAGPIAILLTVGALAFAIGAWNLSREET